METMEVEVETNSEGREDVELVWDDWGHERDVRDHTGDGWDHVEDVVVVREIRLFLQWFKVIKVNKQM